MNYVFDNILPFETINERYNINMQFLEHHSLKLKQKEFLEFQDKPESTEPFPRNSSVNILFFIYFLIIKVRLPFL